MTASNMVRGVLILGCAALALTGCANVLFPEMIGATGVAVSAQGDPEGVVVVCDDSLDHVGLTGDRTGLKDDEQNPVLGTWTPDAPISRGVHRFSLTSPTAGWTFSGSFEAFEPGRGYILGAYKDSGNVATSQVDFKDSDVDGLDSATILIRSERLPADTVLDKVCDAPQ